MDTNRTHLQKELKFTKEQGIDIQTEHLEEFKLVLNSQAFEILEKLVTARNNVAQDGFDVIRGNQIDEILHNQVIPFFT
jgi:hypothetical protein